MRHPEEAHADVRISSDAVRQKNNLSSLEVHCVSPRQGILSLRSAIFYVVRKWHLRAKSRDILTHECAVPCAV